MQWISIPYRGIGERRLLDQMAAVLEPFVARYGGQPAQLIGPELGRAWRDEFATDLAEPTLSRCAQAIAHGRPWSQALWCDDDLRAPCGQREEERGRGVRWPPRFE